MKLQRCANGHFYDGDKYPTCPHCQEAGLPGFKDDETVTQPLNRTPSAVTSAGGAARPDSGYSGYSGGGETVPVTKPLSGTPAADDEEKTVGLYDDIFGSGGNTRPPVPSNESVQQTSPCVGWLVCIGGDHIGRDFRLFEGRNTIGRSESNGIALRGDKSVSKEPQAIVAYEPKNNKFFAVPGTSRSLAYVNGQVLLGMTEIHKNDIIELGKAKLMLIPCCDEKFSWNIVAQNNG